MIVTIKSKNQTVEEFGRFRRTSLAGKQADELIKKLNSLSSSKCLISEEMTTHVAYTLGGKLRCHFTIARSRGELKHRVSVLIKSAQHNPGLSVLIFSTLAYDRNQHWLI